MSVGVGPLFLPTCTGKVCWHPSCATFRREWWIRKRFARCRRTLFATSTWPTPSACDPPSSGTASPSTTNDLRNMARDVRRSRDAGRRIGVDWMPRDARVVEKKEESDDHWVTNEQLRPLNDVCTKWCTRVYFPDAFARVNMVANVIRLYDRLRDVSGLRFNIVFKGGVMIRLVLLEFLNDLPLEARLRITEHIPETSGAVHLRL